MVIRKGATAILIATWIATNTSAQTNFPEVEPNSQKVEATPVIGLTAGDTITGVSTGTTTTLATSTATTVDVFRVRTAPLAPGIYQHRLTLTTSTTTGHTGTIRGLNQTGTVGVGGIVGTVDTAIQTTITTSTPPRYNAWYGFGKQEELYYQVSGTATTTANYTATMTTTPVAPTVIAPPFEAGAPITISTKNQTTVDTELLLYDSTFTPVPGGLNDGTFGESIAHSTLKRTLPAGTYYLAVSTFELCSNQTAPADDNYTGGWLTDFPDCIVLSNSSLLSQDYDFQVRACNGTWTQTNQSPAGAPYTVTWFQFTTAVGAPVFGSAPANDNCASAQALTAPATVSGVAVTLATNDGTATCDPGGVASKDVWYSFTNTLSGPSQMSINTCGTMDTVVTVFNGCGGAEIACSDDCAGTPCAGPGSCTSVVLNTSQFVLIRVSDKGLGGCNEFTLNLTNILVPPPPPPHDDCSTPTSIAGFGLFPINTFGATTGTQGQNEPLCNQFGSTVAQDVWYSWTATASGTVEVTTCGLIAAGPSQDSHIAIYSGVGCPTTGTAIACNDDGPTGHCPGFSGFNARVQFPAVCGNVYTIQMGMYPFSTSTMSGQFSVALLVPGASCDTPTTPFCLGDGTGAPCPCGNTGAAGHGCGSNAFAGGAILSSAGVAGASAGTDTLVLTATDIPGPGLFFQSNGLLATPANFGDGHLCAAVGIIRLGVVFPTSGVASYPGGLTPNPIHIQGGTANGQTKHYQCWYRSVPGLCGPNNYDLTQGLTLVWGP
ncbi:MAG: hypothetical protein JNL28_14505 [Planctomycetes bacterium]|nr:hypothetical protein [Planctomycetota bacterium]